MTMGRFIDDRFEAEFTVEESAADVWRQLESLKTDDGRWFLPGFEAPATELEADPPRRLEANKDVEPCKDTTIALELESVERGTRVLVVQSGFPAWVKGSLDSFTIGGNQIVADLALYLRRGVRVGRHWMPWAFPGFTAREVDTGLEVVDVLPSCFGERLGLEPGDLLLTLGGAPLFTHLEMQALLRVFPAGEELEATWVRGRDLQAASASL